MTELADQIHISLERLVASTQVTKTTLINAKVSRDTIMDMITDRWTYQIEGFFLAGAPARHTISVEVPASWWEHFKRDAVLVFLAWLSQWWLFSWAGALRGYVHVRTTTVYDHKDINRRVCPHAPLGTDVVSWQDAAREHVEFLVRANG